jgi:hypothetical protein
VRRVWQSAEAVTSICRVGIDNVPGINQGTARV